MIDKPRHKHKDGFLLLELRSIPSRKQACADMTRRGFFIGMYFKLKTSSRVEFDVWNTGCALLGPVRCELKGLNSTQTFITKGGTWH